MRTKFLFVFLLLGAFLCIFQPANAATVTFNLGNEFSGAFEPAGSPPWARATFTDLAPGTVRLTMSALNLTGSEFISEWFFNLETGLNPNDLTFDYVDATAVGGSGNVSISTGVNNQDADGQKGFGFDIRFGFPFAASPAGNRFTNGEEVIYDIEDTTITANSFNLRNKDDQGEFKSAAHVQGIGGNDNNSGFIATPIPGSALLLAPGLILLVAIGRKFRSKP
jgi:hypothetical protein